MKRRHKLTFIFCFGCLAGVAHANLLTNPSFESPALSTNDFCISVSAPVCPAISGWTGQFYIVNGSAALILTPPPPIPDGTQFSMLQLTEEMDQSVNIPVAGQYTLTWYDAGRGQGGNFGGNESYDIVFGGNTLGTFSTTTNSDWKQHSLSFFSTAGSFTLAFAGLTDFTVSGDNAAFVDDVSIDPAAATPEPGSTWLILGAALVVTAANRWQRVSVRAGR